MYNEKKMDWKTIAVHDTKNVLGFFGDYRYLSNFHLCPVKVDGITYPSSENAFQALKVVPGERERFIGITPAQSKLEWKECSLVDKNAAEWDSRKYGVMYLCVYSKFEQNSLLRSALVKTEDRFLEETLWWRDTYWGYDVNLKQGDNNLGHILMDIRSVLSDRKY